MKYDCKICDKNATIMVQTGNINILEVRDINGGLIYDWSGGGGINHYLCDECLDGLQKELWKKGGAILDSY